MNTAQLDKVRSAKGFVAALDQSGGSTPRALELYGIPKDAYADEGQMFDLMHAMRARIISSPSFRGDRILAAILFEGTMDRQVEGVDTPSYLWGTKQIVPFLKIDKGLAEEAEGVQLMKPIPDLDGLLARAVDKGIFGTKARSVGRLPDEGGIKSLVDQQFELAERVLDAGLVPILEPEIDIHSPHKAQTEALLKPALIEHLDALGLDRSVMLKLTLPEVDDFYLELVEHPRVLRVVALSGGYSREEANARLARNHGVVASFSRALTEGLSVHQSDAEFNAVLDASIESIYSASTNKEPRADDVPRPRR
jgi:fructose-bisphosphate aldolase class I